MSFLSANVVAGVIPRTQGSWVWAKWSHAVQRQADDKFYQCEVLNFDAMRNVYMCLARGEMAPFPVKPTDVKSAQTVREEDHPLAFHSKPFEIDLIFSLLFAVRQMLCSRELERHVLPEMWPRDQVVSGGKLYLCPNGATRHAVSFLALSLNSLTD